MENSMVSIIVPVYKAEKYIERCINSLINQTYHNIEVILVDDGSPDNCPKICDQYNEVDNRIKVVHQKNSGPSIARNNGIDEAKGDYIAFVDSDDYISKDYIKCMIEIAKHLNADIVSCTYTTNNKELELESTPNVVKVFTPEDAIKAIMEEKNLFTAPWGKLISKQIMNGIYFPPDLMHEDLAVIYRYFDNSNKIVLLSNKMYYYEENPDSITQSKFSEKKLDLFKIMDDIIAFLSNKYPDLVSYAKNRDTRYAISYYKQALSIKPSNHETMKYLRRRIMPNISAYLFSRYSIRSKLYGILICTMPNFLTIIDK